MNTCELEYFDKKNHYGNLIVNGRRIGIGLVDAGYDKNLNVIRHYQVTLANDFNMSAPVRFHAKTIKGLIGQITRHQYRLVKA